MPRLSRLVHISDFSVSFFAAVQPEYHCSEHSTRSLIVICLLVGDHGSECRTAQEREAASPKAGMFMILVLLCAISASSEVLLLSPSCSLLTRVFSTGRRNRTASSI